MLLSAVVATAWSCADDKSTYGGNPISEISIDATSIDEEYNLNKNDVLTITPVVSQSIAGKELSYEWEVEHEVFSTSPELEYTCDKLGSFNCRLIVSNEDGKAFYPFVINVNTPYEEGITIISKDADGNSMLSFMLHHVDGTPDYFYSGDMFSLNNPEIPFASNVSDMIISNSALVISCQGSGSASDPASIYYLNEKTFDIENYVTLPEYPTFKPIKMMLTSVAQGGASYPVLSSDGVVYEFASTEGTVIESSKFPSIYDTNAYTMFDAGTGNNFNIYFWDSLLGIPFTMDRNYVFYCVVDYSQSMDRSSVNSTNNIFAPGEDQPVAMFLPRLTSAQISRGTEPELYIITDSHGTLRRTVLDKDIWTYNSQTQLNVFDAKKRFETIGETETSLLQPGVPMIASNTNKMLFFGVGNKIYQWPYEQNTLAYTTLFAEVGSSSSVITSIEISANQKTLYVASYDPSQSGLNGSYHEIEIIRSSATDDVSSGERVDYNNVCYEPVKMMYKAK